MITSTESTLGTSSLPISPRVAWKGRGGHTASEQPASGTVAGSQLVEAAGGGGPHLARKRLPPHRADWPGFQARWKEERLWPDRLHGAVERENGPRKRELDFSGISRAAGSGAVGRIQQDRGRRWQRCIDRGVGRGSGLKFGALALSECSLCDSVYSGEELDGAGEVQPQWCWNEGWQRHDRRHDCPADSSSAAVLDHLVGGACATRKSGKRGPLTAGCGHGRRLPEPRPGR